MLEIFKLLPIHIAFFILIVVFVTLLTVRLRRVLYHHLEDSASKVKRLVSEDSPGKQPKIVGKVERRYQQASQVLENVNTSALLEGIYQEEKFPFLGKDLKIEQWDYFCRILPNLLIAFGLLGTFLGITQNLTSISDILNTNNAGDMIAMQSLKEPLKSMGIAFSSSLVALLCSSIMTIINFVWNTNIAKSELLTALEDYLDNIYQPTIEGHTRLDKAVDRMVNQQNEFLINFHANVSQTLATALNSISDKVIEGNRDANQAVIQLANRFTESSGTISNSADTFLEAARFLENQVNQIKQVIQHENFVAYATLLESSTNQFKQASETLKNSQFADKLTSASDNIARSQQQFADSVLQMSQSTEQLKSLSETLRIALDTLDTLGITIDTNSTKSAEILDTAQQQISNFDQKSQLMVDEVKTILTTFTNHEANLQSNLEMLGDKLVNYTELSLVNNNNQIVNLQQEINLQLKTLVESIKQQSDVFKQGLQDHAEWQVKENSKGRKDNLAVYQNLERSFLNLGEINSKLTRLIEILNQQINNSNSQSNVTNLIDKLKGI
ncbi:MAG: hypothetical protein VKL42_02195 [Snowella sp.]|nr:hypothetical protein [Snowella sp.]